MKSLKQSKLFDAAGAKGDEKKGAPKSGYIPMVG